MCISVSGYVQSFLFCNTFDVFWLWQEMSQSRELFIVSTESHISAQLEGHMSLLYCMHFNLKFSSSFFKKLFIDLRKIDKTANGIVTWPKIHACKYNLSVNDIKILFLPTAPISTLEMINICLRVLWYTTRWRLTNRGRGELQRLSFFYYYYFKQTEIVN